MDRPLEWLVVGGGIHGTYLSHVLVGAVGVAPDRVRVLDPEPEPLAAWHRRVQGCGMGFLRSPAVHHLDLDPFSLMHFAESAAAPPSAGFAGPYQSPSICLFEAHSRAVVEGAGLADLRLQGSLLGFERSPVGYRVDTTLGSIDTRRLLLAVGPPAESNVPSWALRARAAGARIEHVFEADALPSLGADERVLVVGGGCTAAHTALEASRRAPGNVLWTARAEPLEHEFDADPGWLGPKYLEGFALEPSAQRRRDRILSARRPGSLPARLRGAVYEAVEQERLAFRRAEPDRVEVLPGRRLAIGLDAPPGFDSSSWVADRILLATGFQRVRPGGSWLERAIDGLGLPVHEDGYPLLAPTLEWSPGLFLTGELAELELGPVARNIGGARLAGKRLLQYAQLDHSYSPLVVA